MSGHTPGPWTYRKANSGEERWWVEADYKGEGPWYLAECAARPGENEANARLIAAAPELLEACRRALPWLASTWRQKPGVSTEGAAEAERLAYAAIAKAEGR